MHRLFLPTAGGRVAVDRIGAVGPVAEPRNRERIRSDTRE